MTNEFILQDRLQKIRQIINQYGKEKFAISFSGGKDSTVLSALVDMAVPGNAIPRIFADTGIELKLIRDFVIERQKTDSRVVVIKPSISIKRSLEEHGYPFKSKAHSKFVERYQRIGKCDSVKQYLGEREDKKPWSSIKSCPKKLKYQFETEFSMRVSDNCCVKMKEEPLANWQKEHGKPYAIVGIMREEGGRRDSATEWEEWFIKGFDIQICDIYKPPYNFTRTGCKGCPFALKLQNELDTLEKFFPAERKQCEAIWKPVYEEYRKLGYRLRDIEKGK